MKWSTYNYMFESKKYGYLLYNSFTNAFAKLEKEAYVKLNEIKENINENHFNTKEEKDLLEALKYGKIIVENDFDGVSQLKVENMITRTNEDHLTLTLVPTTDCNFKCFYCFEPGELKKYMNDETEGKLIDFIKSHKKLESVSVTWYGGEPLLAFSKIKSITEKILSKKVKYQAAMVTNGYLLNKEIISELNGLKINHIQITIDGLEELHNKRRPHKTENDSFGKIMSNLDILMNSDWKGEISIRVNIDKNNKNTFNEVRNYINLRYNNNSKIYIYPGYVQNVGETKAEKLSNCMADNDILNFEYSEFKENKNMDLRFFPQYSSGACTANVLNSYIIGPEGEIYKCWNDVGNETRIVGNIDKDIESGNTNLMIKYLSMDPFNDSECLECFYLPICMGGCPYTRLMNKYYDKNIERCSKFKNNIETYLEMHYESKFEGKNKEKDLFSEEV